MTLAAKPTASWHYRDEPGERSVTHASETLYLSIYAGEDLMGRLEVPVVQLPWTSPDGRRGWVWWGPTNLEIVYQVRTDEKAITFTRLECSAPREVRAHGIVHDTVVPAALPVTIHPGHTLTLNMANALLTACL